MSGKLATDPLTQTATTKNQFSGFCYDLAGNLLGQSGCPGLPYTPTYSYDAENRMTTTAGVTYSYDGDGKRVKKSSGPLYWTGMGSDALDETDLAGTVLREYVFFNGKRVARLTPPSTVRYFYSDHLGSHDLVTSATGAIQEESDYHPYGEEAVIVDTLSTQPYKFTGKERDSEFTLDYFDARHYASALGRFMQPDEPFADQQESSPQSWNMYAYVRNNPLNRVDPNGRVCTMSPNGSSIKCDVVDKQTQAQEIAKGRDKGWANSLWGFGQLLSYITPAGWMYHALGGSPLTEQPSNPAQATGMRIAQAEMALTGLAAGFTIEEQAIADLLTAEGGVVVSLDVVKGQKNPDALVNGVLTEFKTLQGTGPNSLKNQIEEGIEQGQNVVVDARNVPSVTRQYATQQIQRVAGKVGSLQGRVTILTQEGPVKH